MLIRFYICGAAALAMFFAHPIAPVMAQEPNDQARQEKLVIDFFPSAQDPYLNIGLGIGAVPDYEGSGDYIPMPQPIIDGRYGPFLINGPSLSLVVVELSSMGKGSNGARVQVGPTVGLSRWRNEGRNDALIGLGNVEASVEVGGFMRANVASWMLDIRFAQDVGNGHDGLLASVGAMYMIKVNNRMMIAAGPSTSWASGNYMQSFFGVTNDQAALSSYLPFEAKSGFKDVSAQLQLLYMWSDKWTMQGQARYSRLLNSAANSPIVSDYGSADQVHVMLGLSYRF
jgi:outer membrane protein